MTPTQAQVEAVTDDMIKAGCEAIDAYYNGTKDAPFEGSVIACYLAMRSAALAVAPRMMQRMENSIAATPTQAQIEAEELCAALDKMAQRFGARFAPDQQKVAAYVAAITAAAEVDMKCGGNHRIEAIKTLTAAAEMGELAPLTNSPERLAGYLAEHKELTRLATIERCAQVADATGGNGYAIAAAIRALKNAPSRIEG